MPSNERAVVDPIQNTTVSPVPQMTKAPTLLAPGTTAKKLPWLDSKSSSSLSPSIYTTPEACSLPEGNLDILPPLVPKRPRITFIENASPTRAAESTNQLPHRPANAPVRPADLEDVKLTRPSPPSVPAPLVPPSSPELKVVDSSQISPTGTFDNGNPFNIAETDAKLDRAIDGLEHLFQEAILVAEEAANQGQVEEVTELLEGATDTLRRASEIPTKHLMASGRPLRLSSSLSDESVSSASSASSTQLPASRRHKRFLEELDPDDYMIPRSPESVPLPPSPSEARIPVAIDWADRNPVSKPQEGRSCSTHSLASRKRTRHRTESTELLVPKPVKDKPQEIVGSTSPPKAVKDLSRGRSRRRKADGSEYRPRTNRAHSVDRLSRSSGRKRKSSRSESPNDEELPLRQDKSLEHDDYNGDEQQVRNRIFRHTFGISRAHRHQPIARNWKSGRKHTTAALACFNTSILGIIIGIYAGEVPSIQYVLADENHHVILGNVVLYIGLAISTFIAWPLPLLHGRKPYILASFALALALQFPQAAVVSVRRSPTYVRFKVGLLFARLATGFVLGFANVNFITILLDLFGASLQSKNPHQEFVVLNDVRRHGRGMGLWLGIWSWCSIGSLAIGFLIGAGIIESQGPDWGFYVVVFLLAGALILNIMGPETRRSQQRRSITEVFDREHNLITWRECRGEIKLHMGLYGPKHWFNEVWAGMKLATMMMCQAGFAVLALYLGWIYAQIVLVIVLLGSLLSRDYRWHPQYVGLGVLSIAIGALLAIPLTKANLFSRDRKTAFRTDSMTFQKQVTWSSHLVRRCIFTLTLPFMGLAYTLTSDGRKRPWITPIIFAGIVGFLSVLAIAECIGIIMETFDTCDLQPGVNTRHRLQSMAIEDRRRRTNYSSFPRICAGLFASQTIAFILAGIATQVGGVMTRRIGAQASTGATAGILLFLTILLTLVLIRFKEVQVIPNSALGTRRDTKAWEEFKIMQSRKPSWQPVIIGNPSGKMRRMNVLEMGGLSRWTEIRKLNFLIGDSEEKRKWGR